MLKLKGLYENTKSKAMMRPNLVKEPCAEMKKPAITDVKSAIDRLILLEPSLSHICHSKYT